MEYVLYKAPNGQPVRRIDDVKQYNATLVAVAEQLFSVDGMTPRELMPFPYDPSRPQPWMKYDHLSVQDRLDQLDMPKEDLDLFSAHTNSFGSGATSEIAFVEALRWFCLGGYSFPTMYDAAASFKLGNGGMTNLARHILTQYTGDRVLHKTVKSLRETSTSRVVISCTDDTTYNARRVVCTIPLNCLADISFDPPLPPKKQDAIKQGHINVGEKYHFWFDEMQGNWFANTPDNTASDFVFGLKDHSGKSHISATSQQIFRG